MTVNTIIHSFDRSTASSKVSAQHCPISSFNFQYPLVSLRSSSSCLRLFLASPSLKSPIFPSITCFRRHIPCKMWPILLAFLLFIVCTIFPSTVLYVILPQFSHDRSNWSSPSFSSTTFQNLPHISDLLSGMSKFQQHIMPCSYRST